MTQLLLTIEIIFFWGLDDITSLEQFYWRLVPTNLRKILIYLVLFFVFFYIVHQVLVDSYIWKLWKDFGFSKNHVSDINCLRPKGQFIPYVFLALESIVSSVKIHCLIQLTFWLMFFLLEWFLVLTFINFQIIIPIMLLLIWISTLFIIISFSIRLEIFLIRLISFPGTWWSNHPYKNHKEPSEL